MPKQDGILRPILRVPVLGSFVRWTGKKYRGWRNARRIRASLRLRPLRIVLGASSTFEPGWIPTEIDALNILRPKDWERFFRPDSIDAMLAEHVWEHLTSAEGLAGAALCRKYLKPGGYLRLAVPDGLHPNPEYIEWVRVGGSGAGASDHKVLYTYRSLKELLERAGFEVRLYEYFDELGEFHYREWSPGEGRIRRSKRFDKRNRGGALNYTSVVADAYKPEGGGTVRE